MWYSCHQYHTNPKILLRILCLTHLGKCRLLSQLSADGAAIMWLKLYCIRSSYMNKIVLFLFSLRRGTVVTETVWKTLCLEMWVFSTLCSWSTWPPCPLHHQAAWPYGYDQTTIVWKMELLPAQRSTRTKGEWSVSWVLWFVSFLWLFLNSKYKTYISPVVWKIFCRYWKTYRMNLKRCWIRMTNKNTKAALRDERKFLFTFTKANSVHQSS